MFRHIELLGLSLLPLCFAQVTNDFESGWDQTAWPIYAPSCNQGGNVSLDTTVAHSGHNSIKVAGAGGFCGHIFFGTSQVPAGDVYVRAWVRAAKALTDDHISFITMPDATEGTDKHLRFGAMDQVLIYNRESDDATLPSLSPQGIATSIGLPVGTWECLEYHLGTDGTIETWLNGANIAGLSVGPGYTNANAASWTSGAYVPKISGVYFGWESYGSVANTFWYDDIAIASKRVGCGAGGSSAAPSSQTTTDPKTVKPTTPVSTVTSTPTSKPTTLVTSTVAPTPVGPATSSSKATTPVSPATSSSKSVAPVSSPSSCVSPKYAQCGGIGWNGCTTCAAGSTCKASGSYYSQCL